ARLSGRRGSRPVRRAVQPRGAQRAADEPHGRQAPREIVASLTLRRDNVAMDVRRLLAWYRKGARDLPWRRTRDPYAIWVSEIMLQQTQIATVIPYYERWMKRFPTVKALAKAHLDEVLKVWEGLGYYARARNLRQAARELKSLPKTSEAWRAVPGVGPYTAAAIASIAHGERAAVFD